MEDMSGVDGRQLTDIRIFTCTKPRAPQGRLCQGVTVQYLAVQELMVQKVS
jgi:hypothetical protein